MDRAKSRFTALHRTAGGHVLALTDQAVVSAASFLTTLIVSRYSDAAELGTYAIGISILASVYTIQGQLISLPYAIQRHEPIGTPAEHAGGSMVLSGLLATLITLLLLIAALTMVADHAGPDLLAVTWAIAGVMPFALFRDFFRRYVFTHLQMAQALVLDSVVATIQIAMLAYLGWVGQMSAVTATIALGVSSGIAALGWLYFSHARFAFSARQVRATMKQSWNLGKWLVVNQIMVQVQRYSTYWFAVLIAGAAVTGVYTACMSIVAFTNPLFYGLNNLLTQKSVLAWQEGGGAGLRRQALRDLLLLAAALGPFSLLALWIGDDLMVFLYHGREYEGHGYIIALLSFATLASALGSPAGNALASMERTRAVFAINAIGTLLTVIVVWRLLSSWGLAGASYGLLLSNAIVSLGLWAGFLLLLPRAPDGSPARQVLQELTGLADSENWVVTRLGEGDHSRVYGVQTSDGQPVFGAHHSLVIKIYKTEAGLPLAMVRDQFASLSRLHETLHGFVAKGWTISTPKPLYICESPLALVMTTVAGKNLKSSTATDDELTMERLDALGSAFIAAMQESWSRGQLHGDLGLQNILYDIQTKQLSLIDPGTRECCLVCNDATSPWEPGVMELGHILRDLGTDVRDLTGNPLARMRRQTFTESALRAFLQTMSSKEERQLALADIRACAHVHLSRALESSWSLRVLCKRLVTRFAVGRMDAVLSPLQAEAGTDDRLVEDGHADSSLYATLLQLKGSAPNFPHAPCTCGCQQEQLAQTSSPHSKSRDAHARPRKISSRTVA